MMYISSNKCVTICSIKSQIFIFPAALDLLLRQAQKPNSQLKGHDWTMQYLQRLGAEYLDLITDYAGWVLKAHPEDGLKVVHYNPYSFANQCTSI